MIRYLLLILWVIIQIVVLPTTVSSQNIHRIDSLKQVISTTQDTLKVRALFQLAMPYQFSMPDTAMHLVRQSLSLAEKLGDEKGRGDALITRGRLKREDGRYDEALEDLTTSLSIYSQLQDSAQMANALNDISIVYAMSGDDPKALEYFEETLTLFQKLGDDKGVSQLLNNIGVIHRSAGNLAKAKDYFLESLQIKEGRRDTSDLPRSYANLGSVFYDMGINREAWRYYQKADTLFRIIQDQQGIVSNLNAMARLSRSEGRLQVARAYAVEGLRIAQANEAPLSIQKTSHLLAELSEQLNDYAAAYRYLELYTDVKDSLFTEQQANHLDELKAQFDSEQQVNRIALLEKEKELQNAYLQQQKLVQKVLLSGIILLLILLTIFIYAYRVNRRQKKLLTFQYHEIQQQKEELREMNRTKDRFFSIISHDIRGPLNSLKGFVFILSEQIEMMSRQEMKEISDHIEESLQNLLQLLDNILTWSLSQIKQGRLDPTPVSLHDLTSDIFRLYSPTANEKQLSLVNNTDAEVFAWADQHSIHTVLRNLVANSIKFSYPGSTITVNASINKDEVIVGVTDEGVGMDQATINELFSLDKKTSGTGTANEKGSGFGLVLCKELVNKNGGELRVTSEPGKGSTFTFALPLAEQKVSRKEYQVISS